MSLKVFPTKAPKLTPGPAILARQDTIDESGEVDHSPHGIRDKSAILSEQRLSQERQDSISSQKDHLSRNVSFDRDKSEIYDSGLREHPCRLTHHDLIATVMDIKVDMQNEMQHITQRIARMEDMLTEIIKRSTTVESSDQSTPDDPPAIVTTTVVSTTPPGGVSSPDQSVISIPVPYATPSPNTSDVITQPSTTSEASGSGLGPLVLRKRRSKARKAPAPPVTSPEQTRLLEAEPPPTPPVRKREFL